METPVTLIKKDFISEGIVALSFERKNYHYDFFPGQYVTIHVPVDPADGNGKTRDFTIASSPLQKDSIIIVTKEGKTEAKKALTSLEIGQSVSMTRPHGGFYLREENKSHRIFLSGGIGITPFYSMITYNVDKQLHIPMTLMASFSVVEHIIFFDELLAITKQHPEIHVIYTLSREKNSSTFEKGRISQELIQKYGGDIHNSFFMIAGAPEMVDDTIDIVEKMGIKNENIQSEQFPGY